MKILAIDDQQLVLLPLEKRLISLDYEVKIIADAQQAKSAYDTYQPDLVIVDINMPKVSGIEIIKYIRQEKKHDTPIMVLSGNTQNELIVEAFELGVEDYMKKPLSLDEVCARVKRLIGGRSLYGISNYTKTLIEKRCVGVVIPCYNEEVRLLSEDFLSFVDTHTGYHLCFVNDGSTDQTLSVLENLRKGREDYISIYDCQKNGGKAEAVRLGMLHLAKFDDLDYIGFLDADLSTDLQDFDDLVKTIETNTYQIVSGSRISRMGANINKDSARKLISKSINYSICKILNMNFKDTQCGAKIMDKEIINIAFNQPFYTRWLFDVEIFLRIRQHFGLEKARQIICEQPLKRWVHADGSKLSYKDSLKIIGQIGKIGWLYSRQKDPSKFSYLKPHVKIKA